MNKDLVSFRDYRDQILLAGLPARLHHYTDSSGSLGILQNEELWLTHARYSNDKAELKYAVDLASRVVSDCYDISRDRIDELDSPYHLFLEALNGFLVIGEPSRDVYICCFCEDQDLLSQWRAYSGKTGFCIGLNSKELLAHTRERYASADVFFSRVLYDPDTWVIWILKALEEHKILLNSLESYTDHANQEIIKLSQSFKNDVLLLAPFLKHPGFCEEQEWRLSVAFDMEMIRPEFRAGKVGLIPFLKSKADNSIESVNIGPTEEKELAIHAIRMIASNMDLEISSTEVPLR